MENFSYNSNIDIQVYSDNTSVRRAKRQGQHSPLTGWKVQTAEDTNYGEEAEGVPGAGAVHLQSTAEVSFSKVPNPQTQWLFQGSHCYLRTSKT